MDATEMILWGMSAFEIGYRCFLVCLATWLAYVWFWPKRKASRPVGSSIPQTTLDIPMSKGARMPAGTGITIMIDGKPHVAFPVDELLKHRRDRHERRH